MQANDHPKSWFSFQGHAFFTLYANVLVFGLYSILSFSTSFCHNDGFFVISTCVRDTMLTTDWGSSQSYRIMYQLVIPFFPNPSFNIDLEKLDHCIQLTHSMMSCASIGWLGVYYSRRQWSLRLPYISYINEPVAFFCFFLDSWLACSNEARVLLLIDACLAVCEVSAGLAVAVLFTPTSVLADKFFLKFFSESFKEDIARREERKHWTPILSLVRCLSPFRRLFRSSGNESIHPHSPYP